MSELLYNPVPLTFARQKMRCEQAGGPDTIAVWAVTDIIVEGDINGKYYSGDLGL